MEEPTPPDVHDPDSPEANGGGTFSVTLPRHSGAPNISIGQFEDLLRRQMGAITNEISHAVSQVKENSTAIKENQSGMRSLRQDIADLKEVLVGEGT